MTEGQALVTGANRGIGAQVAKDLARRGYGVWLACRAPETAADVIAAIAAEGGQARAVALDLTDGDSVRACAATITREAGRLDVLVHNAGILPGAEGPLTAPLDDIRRALETNVLGPLTLTRALKGLLEASPGGRIVHVSSGMGAFDDMDGAYIAYRMSKTALNVLTVNLARELSATRIKVNAVCPGWVRTDMGGAQAPRSVERGASGIVWAATLDDDGPTGGFFRDSRPIAW